MLSSQRTTHLVVAVAALTVLSVVPTGAVGTTADGERARSVDATLPHGTGGNYTVGPFDDAENANNDDPDETCISKSEAPTKDRGNENGEQNCDPYDGHMPGDENVSYFQFSVGGENATEDLVHYINHYDVSKDMDMSGCVTLDAAVAGIDRGNDDSGTTFDESLLSHAEKTTQYEHKIVLNMGEESDLATDPLRLNRNDEIVAQVEDCYTNPPEPGWYQFRGFANGTSAGDGGNASYMLKGRNITVFRPWIRAVTCGNNPSFERHPRISHADV